ncbi:hypothetical protein [Blastomonas sp.]|uniref:hypothetical protein n=1 Tax=Blastomonas sp. TaxID=1909299 RepID=UPI00406AAFB2
MGASNKVFYSAANCGFFSQSVHGALPDDAVPVTAKRHSALIAGQAEGYAIVPDARGRPQLRTLAPATLESTRAACVRAIKREAALRIENCMPVWRQINALRDNRDPGFHRIDAIRAASDLIEEQVQQLGSVEQLSRFPVSTHPLWPSLDASEIDS